jgi:hypothetical protein
MCILYDVSYITQSLRKCFDLNAEAVKNVHFRCRLSFSDVLGIVAALYNPFQTRFQPCFENGSGICPASIIICKQLLF